MKPNVFIPNRGYHDFSEASRFGDLLYLTSGKISILSIGRMYRTFMPIIQSSTKEDYILVSGPSVMTSILCSMFSIKHNVLNLLIYQIGSDNRGHYKQRRISFDELKETNHANESSKAESIHEVLNSRSNFPSEESLQA